VVYVPRVSREAVMTNKERMRKNLKGNIPASWNQTPAQVCEEFCTEFANLANGLEWAEVEALIDTAGALGPLVGNMGLALGIAPRRAEQLSALVAIIMAVGLYGVVHGAAALTPSKE
jgi:hypothetical protein